MALRRITLRDFVLVESLELELQDGFNVLTGETGAGKSILLEALQLVMGARADAQVAGAEDVPTVTKQTSASFRASPTSDEKESRPSSMLRTIISARPGS